MLKNYLIMSVFVLIKFKITRNVEIILNYFTTVVF